MVHLSFQSRFISLYTHTLSHNNIVLGPHDAVPQIRTDVKKKKLGPMAYIGGGHH